MRRATLDQRMGATVVSRQPMHYARGADRSLDRPAHVRAGSAAALVGDRLFVVQDDASFLALVDPREGTALDVPLSPGPGGARTFDDARGNKRHKLDLEACFAWGGRFIALGSGSTTARYHVVDWSASTGTARVVDLPAFYERLKACAAFAGPELNVEGACVVVVGALPVLRLFQRGNAQDGVNATCDVPLGDFLSHLGDPGGRPAPEPRDVVRYDLGEAGGCRLGFTDATTAKDDRRVVYLAAAEDCPDVTRDGPVTGVAVGVVDERGARYALLRDAHGAPVLDKAEGIALVDDEDAWVVVDRDDPDAPSELLRVRLSSFAPSPT